MTDVSTMRCSLGLLLAALMVLVCAGAAAAQGHTYGLGRTPSDDELHPWDEAIGPNGDGLPPGSGTAEQGAAVFSRRRCGECHGPTGAEGPAPRFVGPLQRETYPGGTAGFDGQNFPGRGISNFPFAPLIWSFINKAMPLNQRGYLTDDEIYSLTAYLLYLNGIVGETDLIDARALREIRMPNRDGYVPPPEWKPGMRQAEVK